KRAYSIPVGDCVCGCNGLPMTAFSDWEIDYNAYQRCPARLRRKAQAREERRQRRAEETARRRDEAERNRANERRRRAAVREREARERHRLELAEEGQREIAGTPALSAAEAKRRGLNTFIGSECGNGHSGERLARNGECVECRMVDAKRRDAMRRGAFPEDLTRDEREQIRAIYRRAQEMTKRTGIEHHVDHKKPLKAGGRHHPLNLQILTASENLKKGASWPSGDQG
ncbi:MAG: HNH endonuclease signature motif containing protein, partial [Cyanobacteria bacterium J06648_11]